MYQPPNTITLDKAKPAQIRLGIQGYGGTGKTWAALTFPNPVVLNLDRGLGAHIGRADVIEVPFYDADFCKKLDASYNKGNLKDLIMRWLDTEAVKLEEDQTLVFDGNTPLQNAYHNWWAANPAVSGRSGKIDERAEWGLKLPYYAGIMERFKTLKCHVIFIAHEAEKKDKDGEYTGKIRPLLRGSFGDEIVGYFTDWMRQLAATKPTDIKEDKLKLWGMSKAEFETMLKEYPRDTVYFWQTASDDVFDGKVSSLVNYPTYLPASYKWFQRYQRKQ